MNLYIVRCSLFYVPISKQNPGHVV